jgi:amino acid transporter
VLAQAVFNVVATAAGARLLFGMGRDEVLPKRIFAAVHHRWRTPYWNIILITSTEFILGILFKVDTIADLVNYGALLGFMLLNLTVIWLHYGKDRRPLSLYPPREFLRYCVTPLLGTLVIAWCFIHMHPATLILGTVWLCLGYIYSYRSKKMMIFAEECYD